MISRQHVCVGVCAALVCVVGQAAASDFYGVTASNLAPRCGE